MTLVELLVGVTLLSSVMSTVGISLFQALTTERVIVDDGLAINELRRGVSWFADDVMMAQTSDLVDAAPATSTVTFNWINQYNDVGQAHSSSYAHVGDRLVRTYDGASHTVAQRITSVTFSRSGDSVTVQLEVDAGNSTTRTLSLQNTMGAPDNG